MDLVYYEVSRKVDHYKDDAGTKTSMDSISYYL